MTSDTDDHLISGIYNYCDRWCERCEYTTKCRMFAEENSREPLSNDPLEDAVLTVARSFAEALRLLEENAAKFGIDLKASDPDLEAAVERRHEAVNSLKVVKEARDLALETFSLLDNSETLGLDREDSIAEDMLQIIGWYAPLLGAKFHRGYHGIVDLDGNEDGDALKDPYSDANGSVKVGLIAADNCILAWTYLISETNKDLVKPMIERLESVRSHAETKFPIARDFVRPGFDEIQTVM